jgi:protein-disulfide isomerase
MAKKAEEGRRRGSAQVVTKSRRKSAGGVFWLAIAAVIVVGAGTLYYQTTKEKVTARTIDPTLPKLKAEGYLVGSPTAPIEIIEFGDFECPSCGQFATLTEPDMRERIVGTGKARFRFMDFPLPMHLNTWDASLAAACANEQGKFWQMHDLLFQNQDRWNGEATKRPRGQIGEYAKTIGLDMPKYNSCMDTEKYRANIQANLQEGERRQVASTPTFIIGGKMYPGALGFDELNKHVDDAIAAAGGAAAVKGDTGKKTK